jgi:hypothetical protein
MILLASALAHSSSQVLVQLCLVARLVLRLRLSLRPRRSLLGLVTDSCRTAAEPTPEVKEPRQLRELSSKAKRHSKVNRLLLEATPTREAATLVSSNRVRLLKDRDRLLKFLRAKLLKLRLPRDRRPRVPRSRRALLLPLPKRSKFRIIGPETVFAGPHLAKLDLCT